MGKAQHTKAARLICGTLATAMGLVPLVVNWPYLFTAGGNDPVAAWLAAAAGAVTAGVGIYLLFGGTRGGRAEVLTDDTWRYGYASVIFAVCVLLLVGALFLDQPTVSTGVPALLVISPLLMLFVRADASE